MAAVAVTSQSASNVYVLRLKILRVNHVIFYPDTLEALFGWGLLLVKLFS
jgi:hypothetical protein